MTTAPVKDYPITWDEMHRTARALAWRLIDKGPDGGKWRGVVAVTRGGLIPSYIVARELDIQLIETLCISNYNHKETLETKIIRKPEIADGGRGWLVIDDLVDTGKTFKIAREFLPNAHYACLYAKPQGAKTADTYIGEVSQDTWIFFPWYMEIKYAEPIADGRKAKT